MTQATTQQAEEEALRATRQWQWDSETWAAVYSGAVERMGLPLTHVAYGLTDEGLNRAWLNEVERMVDNAEGFSLEQRRQTLDYLLTSKESYKLKAEFIGHNLLFIEARSFAAMTDEVMQEEHLRPLTDRELERELERVLDALGSGHLRNAQLGE
jgi:hypothetical protein